MKETEEEEVRRHEPVTVGDYSEFWGPLRGRLVSNISSAKGDESGTIDESGAGGEDNASNDNLTEGGDED